MNLLKPLIIVALLCPFAGKGMDNPIDEARQRILFRSIGHELLLSVNDRTSRVPPLQKIDDGSYRLDFEKPFAFMPDSLVVIVGRNLSRIAAPPEYIFTVTEVESQATAYGFTTADIIKGTVPCTGRALPKRNYVIKILVVPAIATAGVHGWNSVLLIVTGLLVLAVLIFIIAWKVLTKSKQNKAVATVKPDDALDSTSIPIGKYRFYPDKYLLLCDHESTELTAKEGKLLSIFTSDLNQVIDRNRLLKEGWEDDGVITGRSLDMYVSKLRKRLEKDVSVSITNVHGKGYCLNAD
ncbi:winged helix-turn-helix domain-containing protein [Mucilaginibacter flavidus]|uniref:winged helix-turn-helix domain-containing protein n=1 Tax=Mucilaginibacter flavidus TaxID=2949309 RepID=UPI0020922013|nr:helix-turn-helix domain-containing protein [Mucilaginibacter flavidus]MCO5945846.1 winged helix-turn-helix domain-containing protein [Mucilaginibacter flavidus]